MEPYEIDIDNLVFKLKTCPWKGTFPTGIKREGFKTGDKICKATSKHCTADNCAIYHFLKR